ncbi:hypothetical protein [Streptosporangium sp. KLBMP 9127]|nr:hypothetical protein [Streptosporangium sp. KLBMP 9127]
METARLQLAEVPKMAPVYAHRFLPAGRGAFGHPVLSMRGWDTIYYGSDLIDYISQEFEEPRPEHPEGWNPPSHGAVLARLPLTPLRASRVLVAIVRREELPNGAHFGPGD